jgi:hypothetical protein
VTGSESRRGGTLAIEIVEDIMTETGSPNDNHSKVYIRRQWNDWRIGSVQLSQIEGLHWDDYSGGVWKRAPQLFIHGYVYCTDVDGEISHSCLHGPPPHRIKVCVVKKDNAPRVFEMLLAIVGPKPARNRR